MKKKILKNYSLNSKQSSLNNFQFKSFKIKYNKNWKVSRKSNLQFQSETKKQNNFKQSHCIKNTYFNHSIKIWIKKMLDVFFEKSKN